MGPVRLNSAPAVAQIVPSGALLFASFAGHE